MRCHKSRKNEQSKSKFHLAQLLITIGYRKSPRTKGPRSVCDDRGRPKCEHTEIGAPQQNQQQLDATTAGDAERTNGWQCPHTGGANQLEHGCQMASSLHTGNQHRARGHHKFAKLYETRIAANS